VEERFHELPTSDVTTSTAGKKRVMTNDAEAQQVRATATSPGPRQGPMADDPAEPSGLVGEEDMADPDAVIIEEDIIAEEGPADTAGPAGTTGTATTGTIAAGATAAGTTRANVIPEAARPVPAQGNGGGLDGGDPERMHERWAAIQSTFVDDPRGAVAAAADLVTEAIAALVASAQERERGLRGEWDRDGADTEDLRNTLRSYRGLLDQLVTR
jgi:hypothetical protein